MFSNSSGPNDDDDEDFVDPSSPSAKDEPDRRKRRTVPVKDQSTKKKKTTVSSGTAISEVLVPESLASTTIAIGEKVTPSTSSSSQNLQVQDVVGINRRKKDGLQKPGPAAIQYNAKYGSLATELINLGMIGFMRVPIPHITSTGSSRSFNDLLKGDERLERYFSRDGNAGSLEVLLAGERPYGRFRIFLTTKVQRGPYGLFLWVNVHAECQHRHVVHGVRTQRSIGAHPHQLYHKLIGFIYKTSTNEYKCIVRRGLGWIDSSSLQSVTHSYCTAQLLSSAVSLLYGYKKPDLFIPVPRRGEVKFSLVEDHKMALLQSLGGSLLEKYDTQGTTRYSRIKTSEHDYHFDQWKIFGARILNVEDCTDFEMNDEQKNRLRKLVREEGKNAYSSVVKSHSPPSTIHIEGDNFLSQVTYRSGFKRQYKLCHRCLSRHFATDAVGKWMCYRHVPSDGSAGIFCIYFYDTSAVQMDLFKVEITCLPNREAPVRVAGYPHAEIRDKFFAASAEDAMGTFFVASCLQILRNAFYGLASPSYTLIRKSHMNLTPSVYYRDIEDMCRLLKINISAVPTKDSVITDDECIRYGVIFPADNKWQPDFPYVYLKEYEGEAETSTLFYVGKCTRREERQHSVCNTKKDFGVHIRNSVVIQTPDQNLVDTLEAATQLDYCIASFLNIKKDGKSVVVANCHVEKPRAVLDGTTFLDYLKLIFRQQFGHKLSITDRH